MSVSRIGLSFVLVVAIVGGAGLMLWPDPLPPYPRPRPDIQVWDASLPPPEGMR